MKTLSNRDGIEIDTKFNEYMSDIENGRLGYLLELELKHFENVLDKNDTIETFNFRRPYEGKHILFRNKYIHQISYTFKK